MKNWFNKKNKGETLVDTLNDALWQITCKDKEIKFLEKQLEDYKAIIEDYKAILNNKEW